MVSSSLAHAWQFHSFIGVNPLQTTWLEHGIVSGRVALLLRSAEIQPAFGRFSDWTQNPITPPPHTHNTPPTHNNGAPLLEGGASCATCPDLTRISPNTFVEDTAMAARLGTCTSARWPEYVSQSAARVGQVMKAAAQGTRSKVGWTPSSSQPADAALPASSPALQRRRTRAGVRISSQALTP